MIRIRIGAALLAVVAVATAVVLLPHARSGAPAAGAAAAAGADGISAVVPTRVVDTRSGIGTAAVPVGEGQTLTVTIAGRSPVPSDATVVMLNVTVDAPTRGGFVTVFPAGSPRPSTSSVNMSADRTVPNL